MATLNTFDSLQGTTFDTEVDHFVRLELEMVMFRPDNRVQRIPK